MSCRALVFAALAIVTLRAEAARAGDVVTRPYPGITYTHRSQVSPRKEIHIVEVDLTRAEISLRATLSSERGRTPSSFSRLVGAAVVVNGDFFNTNGSYDPSGMAMGNGVLWSDGQDSTGSRFIACTRSNDCIIETASRTATVNDAWYSIVGGRRALVKADGSTFSAAQDAECGSHCTTLHPRTAVGLKDGGDTLVLVMVEGRQDPIFGLTISQLATLMKNLGCETAIELDGGGSSTMIVAGDRVSGRPDNEPSERAVANHLAVLFTERAAASTGTLTGFVREGTIQNADRPVAGASVRLAPGGRTTTTAADGRYTFSDVDPGTVTVTVTKDGYVTASGDKVVEAGVTSWRSIALTRTTPPAPEPGPAPPDEPAPEPAPPEEPAPEEPAEPAPAEPAPAEPTEPAPEEPAEPADDDAAVDEDAAAAGDDAADPSDDVDGGSGEPAVAGGCGSSSLSAATLSALAVLVGARRRRWRW